jgi:hypothetical protein
LQHCVVVDVITSGPPTCLELPGEALEPISEVAREALEREVHRVNDRYLVDFIEEYSFCPFARSGRVKGQTKRYVYYADTTSVEPLLDLMCEVAADTSQVVVQVVLPLLEVEPEEWVRFVKALTSMGNARMDDGPVLACAPLHPRLAYLERNAATMIPLFRRAPDPTIQWVRLDGLAAIYEGRNDDTEYFDPDKLDSYLLEPAPKSLYDRIADSNFSMAKRLTTKHVEGVLAECVKDGRQSYTRVLLGDDDD